MIVLGADTARRPVGPFPTSSAITDDPNHNTRILHAALARLIEAASEGPIPDERC
jgi:hypothetical protein